MANRYWVGGTGTWNTSSTTNWSATPGGASGASVPTAADSVFFDQAGVYTVTMTGARSCQDITVSGGSVTFTSTGTLTISGSMSLAASSTTWNATGSLTFSATGAATITTNGVTLTPNIILDGVGGTWTLGSVLTLGETATATLTNGTLNLNNYNLNTGIFSSSNSNTRSIAFGTGQIELTHTTSGTTKLSMANATAFTWTGTTGGFYSNPAFATATYVFGTTGGSSTNAPNLTIFSFSSSLVQTFTSGSWFNYLDFGNTSFTVPTTTLKSINWVLVPANPNSKVLNVIGTGSV
jgi:hypothetical protein